MLSIYCLLPILASALPATTYYVDAACGNDANTGATSVCGGSDGPKRTIQAGIDVSSSGDEIVAAPGTYRESIFIRKAIAIRSQEGAARTAIDLSGSSWPPSRVHFSSLLDGIGTLQGFTVAGATSDTAVSAYDTPDSATIELRDCVFTSNTYRYESVLYVYETKLRVTNCVFYGNGSAQAYSTVGVYSTMATFVNCTFFGNRGHWNGTLNLWGSDVSIANSIFFGDTLPEIIASGSTLRVTHSNVAGGLPPGAIDGGGNISVDPKFVSASKNPAVCAPNLRLLSSSPCIDAGDSTALPPEVVTDIDGFPRRADHPCAGDTGTGGPPVVDMGAYEFQPLPSCGNGSCDVGENCNTCSCDCTTCDPLLVPEAYATIQAAVCAAPNGNEILVGPGIWHEKLDFAGKSLTLGSTDGPEATILDASGLGGSALRLTNGEGPETVVEGFTIQGGSGVSCGPLRYYSCGAGAYLQGTSPTIRDCVFRDNAAQLNGGAIYAIDSSPHILDTRFCDNSVPAYGAGGAIYFRRGAPSIERCRFVGNKAGYGGAIFNYDADPTILSGGFADNSGRGGAVNNYAGSSPTMVNSIFYQNEADYPSGVPDATALSGSAEVWAVDYTDGTSETLVYLNGLLIVDNAGKNPGGYSSGQFISLVGERIGNRIFLNQNAKFAVGGAVSGPIPIRYGGAIVNWEAGTPIVTNCSMTANTGDEGGAALYSYGSEGAVSNSILWGDSPDELLVADTGQASPTPTLRFSNVFGAFPPGVIDRGGNLSVEPLFVGVPTDEPSPQCGERPDLSRLGLRCGSPCLDAGDSQAPGLNGVPTDYAGNQRFTDATWVSDTGVGTPPTVDIGAFEYSILTDPNAIDCQGNGVPDECDIAGCAGDPACADCNANQIPDECDIQDGSSRDTNANGIPDECEDGACCDLLAGGCTENVLDVACSGAHRAWTKGAACVDVACDAVTGACCDLRSGGCADDVPSYACFGTHRAWTEAVACADVVCEAVPGACCDHDPFGACTDGVILPACDCPTCEWVKEGSCSKMDCLPTTIPTVGEWGLMVLALLLLTGAKLAFRRSNPPDPVRP